MIIRDASSLISMPNEKQKGFFSGLRSAFDGKFESSSGISQKDFKAKFGIMIAATPELERSRNMEADLGERFLTYRLNPEDENAVWAKIDQNNAEGENNMKEHMSDASIKFLNTCPTPKTIGNITPEIRALAKTIAHGRTRIPRDRYSKKVMDVVEISEAPFRVGKQLAAYYAGLMTVTESHGRSMNILRKVARDSIRPILRARIIHAILNGQNTSKKISAYLGVAATSIDYAIADLGLLGILNKTRGHKDKRERILSLRPGFEVPFTFTIGS